MTRTIDCPCCDGSGENEDRKGNFSTCRYCKGKGTIPQEESKDDIKEEDKEDTRI